MLALSLLTTLGALVGAQQGSSAPPPPFCGAIDAAGLPQCAIDQFFGKLGQLYEPVPLPDFRTDMGSYRLSVQEVGMWGLTAPLMGQPIVEQPDDQTYHVRVPFNWTEIRANMQAKVSYDWFYSRLLVEGWPEVKLRDTQGEMDFQVRVEQQDGVDMAVLDHANIWIIMPMEIEVMPNLMEVPWYVYMAMEEPEQEYIRVITDDWWMMVQPNLNDWLQRFIQSMFNQYLPEPY